jgi:class 3 adenylate cyclase
MIVLAFRTKLLLAMMAVVVGVTGATIFVTQDRVRRTYERVFQSQAEEQMRFFAELQETRLRGVRQKCLDLNQSVRLRAALEEGDAEVLYDRSNALSELRDILGEGDGSTVASRGIRATFLCFLSSTGTIIPPPEREGALLPAGVLKRLETSLADLKSTLAGAGRESQQIGCLMIQAGGAAAAMQPHEVILTRIVSQEDHHVLGAMVLGFPIQETPENAAASPGRILSGLWIDGRLQATGVPLPLAMSVDLKLQEQVRQAPDEASFDIGTGGGQTRVFYRRINADSGFPPAYRVCFYSLLEMRQEQERLLAIIVAFGGVALVGAFALSLLLSHGLAVPLHALVDGTNAIRRGDYSVLVPVRSRDEIGRLTESFNEMAGGLALKERYRSVLDKVADPAVAEQLMSGGVKLGGETREVSVLFCDIRGFTALTQGMAPSEVISMLNEHFTPLARIVTEHKGVVDKFVGDLIMAYFGAPKAYGKDALQAALCARRMLEERSHLNLSSRYRIEVGIGVATGPALAGCMGANDRLNYTVLGERVNLASRLCSKAGRMEVVIDQTTRDRISPLGEVEPMGDIELKGFSARVPAFKLLELKPNPPVIP